MAIIKAKVLLSQTYDVLFWLSYLGPFVFLAPKGFYIMLALIVGYSRNASCVLTLISTFLLLSLGRSLV
jgi:hypothetical protein